MLTFAPLDLEPLGPILARSPALAAGDSDATYASTEDDWAYAPTARAAKDDRREKRIVTSQSSKESDRSWMLPRNDNKNERRRPVKSRPWKSSVYISSGAS